MHPQRSLGQKKRPFMAKYRHYASKMSWFWQDSRAVYPKSPVNRQLGIHCAKILPARAPFPVRGLQIIHSAHILPSRLSELRKSPTPECPLLTPITILDELPMNFSGEHSAQRLRYEQAPRGRRSDASGWASDPTDKEPPRMAVCPADRALPDDRLPRRSGAFGWASVPADRVPPDERLPPPIESPPNGRLPPIRRSRHPPVPMQTQKGDPVGSPFDSGTDQKNQLKVIVDDPYLYRSSFSFAAS